MNEVALSAVVERLSGIVELNAKSHILFDELDSTEFFAHYEEMLTDTATSFHNSTILIESKRFAEEFKILLFWRIHDSIVRRPHHLAVFKPDCMATIESRILFRRLVVKFNENICRWPRSE